MKNMDGKDLVTLIVTIFVPPVGVAIKSGFGTHFWVNLALTLFGFYIPGLIHGVYVVLAGDS
jgi:uncharacterized membrane protein YqaE (UPF0057 family)